MMQSDVSRRIFEYTKRKEGPNSKVYVHSKKIEDKHARPFKI